MLHCDVMKINLFSNRLQSLRPGIPCLGPIYAENLITLDSP